jgi:hypothetical protein
MLTTFFVMRRLLELPLQSKDTVVYFKLGFAVNQIFVDVGSFPLRILKQ